MTATAVLGLLMWGREDRDYRHDEERKGECEVEDTGHEREIQRRTERRMEKEG